MTVGKKLDALILGVLDGEVLHGYAIAQRIRAANERALRPGEGLIYPTLYRLASDGVIRVEWLTGEGKPARKAYALAPSDAGPGGTSKRLVFGMFRHRRAVELTDAKP